MTQPSDVISAPPQSSAPVVAPASVAPAPVPARSKRWPILDALLVALVVVLGFVLASFAARNSDLLLHLATGRALVQGDYQPWSGTDPFAFTTQGVYWVNHSWLLDVLAYGLFSLTGGVGLVVVKALLVAAVAVILIRLSWTGMSVWLPVVCTALALLAASAQLELRPEIVSCLFLALTLWFVQHPTCQPDESSLLRPLRAYWPLLVLQVAWVNMDSWF